MGEQNQHPKIPKMRRICPACNETVFVDCAECETLPTETNWRLLEMVEQNRMSEDLAKIRVGIEGLTVKIDAMDKRAAEDRAEIAALRKDFSGFPPKFTEHEQRLNSIDLRVAKLENNTADFVKRILVWILAGVLLAGAYAIATNGYRLSITAPVAAVAK